MDTHTPSTFASKSLAEHALRGVIGIGAISGAIALGGTVSPWWTLPAALGLGAVALLAFRGCPICWTIGLFETGVRSWRRVRGSG
jgi:hypothetical protein